MSPILNFKTKIFKEEVDLPSLEPEIVVEFESNLFTPYLPEESQVHSKIYGAELAYWLSSQLSKLGIVTSYPANEAWGWFIEYVTENGDAFWLCCSNVSGQKNKWKCFLEPLSKGFLGRNTSNIEKAEPLLRSIKLILEKTPAISNLKWSSRK